MIAGSQSVSVCCDPTWFSLFVLRQVNTLRQVFGRGSCFICTVPLASSPFVVHVHDILCMDEVTQFVSITRFLRLDNIIVDFVVI